MAELPSGTVTLLFSDIEGSTRLQQRLGNRYRDLLHTHRALLRSSFEQHGGAVVATEGDGFFVAFSRAVDGVTAAVDAQRALASHAWPADTAVRVRMGLHTGEPVVEIGDYSGHDVHRASRICSSAHGGQIVVSDVTHRLAAEVQSDIRFADLGEHWLKDLDASEHLYQVCAPGLAERFPPLRSRAMAHSNLPGQLTSFVGRDREVNALREMLLRHRLVALTGPGGAGKTRLALQAASGLLDHFPDGLWVVQLGGVTDDELVGQAIAATIGLRSAADQTAVESLIGYARDKKLLLVLDNFEHLLPAAAVVAELISRAPTISVLVTTREALKVRGEREMPVSPLELPQPHALHDLAALRRVESVRLFLDRAQSVLPGFELTDSNAAAIAEIVRRLDGLPLAIELAAARVKVLAPQTLASRLADSLALLTGGPRDLPVRQRTLRATIEWSYDLLNEDERSVLKQLSVFHGAVGLETVEATCGAAALDVLAVLTALVDKSLVRHASHPTGELFWTLETVKAFARDKLRDEGAEEQAERRHLTHYEEMSRRAAGEILGPRQVQWLEWMDSEHDDLQAAVWRALAAGDVRRAATIGESMSSFWFIRGHYETGRYWLRQVLATDFADPVLRARVLIANARLAADQGELAEADENLTEAHSTALSHSDELLLAQAVSELAYLRLRRGQPHVTELMEQASDIFRRRGELSAAGEVLLRLAHVPLKSGRYAEARKLTGDALQQMRAAGNAWGIASALNNLGYLAALQGRFDEAEPYLEESRNLFRAVGTREGLAGVTDTLALVTGGKGDWNKAIELYERSLALYRDMNFPRGIAFEQVHLGRAQLERGQHEQAAACLLEGIVLAKEIGDHETLAFAFEGSAALLVRTGRPREAARLHAASRSFRRSVNLPLAPVDLRRLERDMALVSEELDADTLRSAAEAGVDLSPDDIYADALQALKVMEARGSTAAR